MFVSPAYAKAAGIGGGEFGMVGVGQGEGAEQRRLKLRAVFPGPEAAEDMGEPQLRPDMLWFRRQRLAESVEGFCVIALVAEGKTEVGQGRRRFGGQRKGGPVMIDGVVGAAQDAQHDAEIEVEFGVVRRPVYGLLQVPVGLGGHALLVIHKPRQVMRRRVFRLGGENLLQQPVGVLGPTPAQAIQGPGEHLGAVIGCFPRHFPLLPAFPALGKDKEKKKDRTFPPGPFAVERREGGGLLDFQLFDDVAWRGGFLKRRAAAGFGQIDGGAGLDFVKGLVPLDVIGDGGSAWQDRGKAEKP